MEKARIRRATSRVQSSWRRAALIGLLAGGLPMAAQAQPWLPNGTDIYFNGGKVGIGTTAPAYQFDLRGGDMAIDNTKSIYFRNSAGAASLNSRMFRSSGGTLRIVYETSLSIDATDGAVFKLNNA